MKLYPERVTWQLVEEMQSQFIDTFGERSLTAEAHSLSKAAMKMFKTLSTKSVHAGGVRAAPAAQPRRRPSRRESHRRYRRPAARNASGAHVAANAPLRRYEDPSNIDALSRVQTQVEVVKRQMQDNVKQMLSNVDRTDELVDQTGATRLARAGWRGAVAADALARRRPRSRARHRGPPVRGQRNAGPPPLPVRAHQGAFGPDARSAAGPSTLTLPPHR